VAEHLGIATAADIKARRYQPTPDEVRAVRDWLDGPLLGSAAQTAK